MAGITWDVSWGDSDGVVSQSYRRVRTPDVDCSLPGLASTPHAGNSGFRPDLPREAGHAGRALRLGWRARHDRAAAAAAAGEALGKPLVIENRPGAGTTIGAAAVAKAAPDGYTMLFGTTSPLSIAVNVYKSVPYDPVKDFVPVARIGNAAFVFITTPTLKITTLADFVKYAKERPNQISFGSGGTGSMQHLFAELLQSMSGIKMVHVPYRGDNPVITDIIAGHIPVAFVEMGVAMPHIEAGKVVPLGVSSGSRVPAMPNVPTISEAGVPGFDAVSWQMFVVPAGTPRPVVDKLFTDISAVLTQPDVRADFVKAGRIPSTPTSIEEMTEYIKTERDKWRKVTEMAGVAGSQ
jgi:tripartite-type tricarboxylate transporter receptor subunit TctC